MAHSMSMHAEYVRCSCCCIAHLCRKRTAAVHKQLALLQRTAQHLSVSCKHPRKLSSSKL
jgi:hypothetical protein